MQPTTRRKPTLSRRPQAAETTDKDPLTADGWCDWQKSDVECICPKCGKRHMMPIHWIGRGTPRKFCNNCRERS